MPARQEALHLCDVRVAADVDGRLRHLVHVQTTVHAAGREARSGGTAAFPGDAMHAAVAGHARAEDGALGVLGEVVDVDVPAGVGLAEHGGVVWVPACVHDVVVGVLEAREGRDGCPGGVPEREWIRAGVGRDARMGVGVKDAGLGGRLGGLPHGGRGVHAGGEEEIGDGRGEALVEHVGGMRLEARDGRGVADVDAGGVEACLEAGAVDALGVEHVAFVGRDEEARWVVRRGVDRRDVHPRAAWVHGIRQWDGFLRAREHVERPRTDEAVRRCAPQVVRVR